MNHSFRLTPIVLLLAVSKLFADTHYVSLASTNPTQPYASWDTAATNIQDAVDVAVAGDEIVVTNGVYAAGGRAVYGTMTNRVTIDKAVFVHSVNGPRFTVIEGQQVPGTTNGDGAIRCVQLTSGATLSGFILRNGATRSAGDSYQEQSGGGVWAVSATVSNCLVVANSAYGEGGGAYGAMGAFGGDGNPGTLNNCILTGNFAGGGGGAAEATLNNCLITSNSSGTGGGVYGGILNNCTVVGNSGGSVGGAFGYYWGHSGVSCTLNNCIVYFNSGGQDANWSQFAPLYFFNNCCTAPQPGDGNSFTNEPLFLDQENGNFRLQTNSPCVNAGNNSYVVGTTDLDGRPRIVGGIVDIGAYELQSGVSGAFIGWLGGYGLPTDGSADYTDADGDGMNNWQEWISGTDPTNALSALRMLAPTSGFSGITVQWQSVSGVSYYVQRSTSLDSPFTSLATGIAGQPGTTSYDDTGATGPGPFFYRVGVQR